MSSSYTTPNLSPAQLAWKELYNSIIAEPFNSQVFFEKLQLFSAIFTSEQLTQRIFKVFNSTVDEKDKDSLLETQNPALFRIFRIYSALALAARDPNKDYTALDETLEFMSKLFLGYINSFEINLEEKIGAPHDEDKNAAQRYTEFLFAKQQAKKLAQMQQENSDQENLNIINKLARRLEEYHFFMSNKIFIERMRKADQGTLFDMPEAHSLEVEENKIVTKLVKATDRFFGGKLSLLQTLEEPQYQAHKAILVGSLSAIHALKIKQQPSANSTLLSLNKPFELDIAKHRANQFIQQTQRKWFLGNENKELLEGKIAALEDVKSKDDVIKILGDIQDGYTPRTGIFAIGNFFRNMVSGIFSVKQDLEKTATAQMAASLKSDLESLPGVSSNRDYELSVSAGA